MQIKIDREAIERELRLHPDECRERFEKRVATPEEEQEWFSTVPWFVDGMGRLRPVDDTAGLDLVE